MVRSPVPILASALALLGGLLAQAAAFSAPEELVRLRNLHATGRYAEAESLAVVVLAHLEGAPNPDSLALAEASFVLGNARDRQGEWDESVLQAMERAFSIRARLLPPGSFDTALAEMRLGEFLAGGPEKALQHLVHALESFENQPVPIDTLIANCWMDLGQVQTMLGRHGDAIDAIQKALEIRGRVVDPADRGLVTMHIALGDAYFGRGKLEQARKQQEEALRLLDRAGNPDDLLRAGPISRLFIIQQHLGDLAQAIDLAQENVRLAEVSGDTAEIVASKSNLAVVLIELQDYGGACRILSSVLPLCAHYRFSDQWVTQAVRQIYGNASLGSGDTTLALRLFRDAEAGLLEHPDPRGDSRTALCVLGQVDVLMKEEHYAEALPVCERGIMINDAASNPDRSNRVASQARLIRIFEALGDTSGIARARQDLARIGEESRLLRPASLPTALYWLARADHDLGNGGAAWNGALAAESAAHSHQRFNFRTLPDSRALGMVRQKSYILDQVLDLAAMGDSSRWEIAWDRLVRTRGLVGAELARRRVPRELKSDPEVARVHGGWVQAQMDLARRMVKGSAAPADSAAVAELDRLRLEAGRAEMAYAAALQARGADTARVEIGLADVRERLGSAQALVAIAEFEDHDGTERNLVFIARGDRPEVATLNLGPSGALDSLISPWRERLESSPGPASRTGTSEAECRRYGSAVRVATWDRLAGYLDGVSEVTLVGDGPLLDLPWHALPVEEDAYLVEQGPLLSVLDAERDLLVPPKAQKGSMLAMGDPDFSTSPDPVGNAEPLLAEMRGSGDPCAGGLPERFPRLPGTAVESNAVARIWRHASDRRTTVLQGKAATEAAFKLQAPGNTVVHVATHGVVTGDRCRDAGSETRGVGGVSPVGAATQPAASTAEATGRRPEASPWMGRRVWLALAGAEHAGETGRSENDGLLTAEEVVTLDFRDTDWVVLSACHSGLSENWGREGALGMRRAFRLAGARNVIASLWAIEDSATSEWMRELYEARAAGEIRAAGAVAAASRRVLSLRRASGQSTHPFYWAAFSADGN